MLRDLALAGLAVDLFVLEDDVDRGLRGVLAVDFGGFVISEVSSSSSSPSKVLVATTMSWCFDLDDVLDDCLVCAFEVGFVDSDWDGGSNAIKKAHGVSDLAARFRCSAL